MRACASSFNPPGNKALALEITSRLRSKFSTLFTSKDLVIKSANLAFNAFCAASLNPPGNKAAVSEISLTFSSIQLWISKLKSIKLVIFLLNACFVVSLG